MKFKIKLSSIFAIVLLAFILVLLQFNTIPNTNFVSHRNSITPILSLNFNTLHTYSNLSVIIDNIIISFSSSILNLSFYQGLMGSLMVQFLQIPLTVISFISGAYYGVAIFSIISTLAVYLILKPKKWLQLLVMQLVILLAFIGFEFTNSSTLTNIFIKNYMEAIVIVGMLLYTLTVLYNIQPYSIKRILLKYERRIYITASIIGLFAFAIKHLQNSKFSIIIHLLTFSLLILIQYLIHNLKRDNRNKTYLLLSVLFTLFFGLCFMSINANLDIILVPNELTALKLVCIGVFSFGILTNYIFVQKREKQNKANEVYLSQYVMLLKNYHKLLLEEKNTQQTTERKKERITLKEHIDNLCEHLKNEHKLTDREIEVLYLIWDGKTNKDIASSLNITLSTTKYHISNIYIKLNVNSRAQVFALKEW